MTRSSRQTTSSEILDFVFRFRRLAAGHDRGCAARPCADCHAPHLARVERQVAAGAPLHFVLPAFPAKSPNPHKVLGTLPDQGERLALRFLQSFCEALGRLHPPGARVTICSDGHVFADVVGVSDAAVTHYRRELQGMAGELGTHCVDFFSLSDAFGGSGHTDARLALLAGYAEPVPELRERAREDGDLRQTFNGIHRFVFEDRVPLNPGVSRNRVRQECKALAWNVIQRSNAWSRRVAESFPDALRLSIHPQPPHSEKIGFQLLPAKDRWITPWHGVVLETGDGTWLTKRGHAERLHASLVWRDNRPSHFVAPHVSFREVLI
ncbi:pyoverdine biosynthesis protein [Wenjunlia vitaminophila]|uniref:Pyoverdine biosynthesis protein n=1 Tax=Wenjunlia vitaminophila TaxID=76728 RepID=A0A0T6LWQ7_WENVI|nr:isocyanide synthase family protein [Wenjunlia vitaminophila]KRV50542.1 pyoverdine biosynthesis protein [Wenjunlia vitaminophila]